MLFRSLPSSCMGVTSATMLPVIALYHGADLYYANDVHIGTGNSVTLAKYSGAPCSCNSSNASINFPNEVININTAIDQPVSKPLSAEFQKCDTCTYPIHIATELNYSFDGMPPDASKAKILPGGILQVFKDAVSISSIVRLCGSSLKSQ